MLLNNFRLNGFYVSLLVIKIDFEKDVKCSAVLVLREDLRIHGAEFFYVCVF